MCIVSNVFDQYNDRWREQVTPFIPSVPMPHTPNPNTTIQIVSQLTPAEIQKVREALEIAHLMPTREEIEEFRRVVEEARAQDKAEGNPDCEMEEKRQAVKQLADLFGVEIEFV